MLTATITAWADVEVEVDGLRFSVSTGTVPVTAKVIAPAEGVYTGEITIPSSINYNGEDIIVDFINSDAFANATITKVTIPSTVYFIGGRAFYHCENLSEITLPEGLREISVSAFAGCPFTSLTIPGTVTRIDSYGLEGLSSLQKLTFAYSEEKLSMDWSVFNGTNNIIELVIDRDYSFGNNTSISKNTVKKVTFGEHVTKIPENACYDMTLEELNIGANVTAIGLSAFMGCTLPEGYNFPFAQIKEIEEGGFYVCKNLPANIDLTGVEKIEANAFRNSDVQIVKLGSNLTTFGECVFQSCDKLTTLNIPGSINSLTAWWFNGCNALTDVTFDYGSTALTLEDGTFGNATTLTIDRTIDSGSNPISTKVTKVALGSHMDSSSALSSLNLSQCPELTEIELLEGWKEIPYNAFKGLTNFTTLTLPVGLETIGQEAFSGCTGLASVTLPEGLMTIYSNAFTGSGITSVTVPGTVRNMSTAFKGCEHLTSLTLAYSENLTDDGWFYGKGVLISDGSAFEGSPVTDVTIDRAWKPNVWDRNAPIPTAKRVTFGPHATNIPEWMFGDLMLESVTIGENVTQIDNYAFQKCQLPAGATIPFAQFKKIGSYSFSECSNLPTTINLAAVEEIGSYAFQNCTSIESLIIGGGSIEYYAFNGCSNLSSLTLLEGVTKIGQGNFQNLTSLTTVNIPSTVKEIGPDAFNGCENITIPSDLPEGLETISTRAFQNCKKLNVNIPSTVTSLEQGAFGGCESLEKVVIPAGVTYLNMSTFYGCKKLTTVTIPGTLLSMSSYDFGGCDNLKEVIFEKGTEPFMIRSDYAFSSTPVNRLYIDRVVNGPYQGYLFNSGTDIEVVFGPNCAAVGDNLLSGLTNMKSITMSDNVKSLGKSSIYRAKAETLKVSKKLETIGDYAFMAYTFTEGSFTIPFTVKEIGEAAFGQFRSWGNTLKNVYVPWLTPLEIEDNEPEDYDGDNTRFAYADNQTLWVPGGTMDLYKAAPIWKKFKKFEYWSFVVNSSVAGKGTLAIANGEEVTDNGTNTAKSVTGENLVDAGAGEAVSGLFVREKDVTFTATPARGYELTTLTANDADILEAGKVTSLTADQTVVAKFTPIIYNITYNNLQNGVVEPANPATYTVEDAAITLVNPTRTGYNFKGWTGTDIEGASMEVTIPASSIGDREFTATWEPIVYDITYDLAGGSVAEGANPAKYTIETPDFTLVNPTKLGYTFLGWTGTDLTEATKEVTVTTGHWGDRSYTATWEPNPYKVHFDANNGEGTMEDQNFVYDAAQDLTANAFTRTGYTYEGWNTKADGSGTPYTDKQEVKNLTTERDKVVTMYAQWKIITFNVTIASTVNGTVEASTLTPEYGSDVVLTITPDKMYLLKSLTVNGVDVTGDVIDGQYTITEVTSDLTVNAEFKECLLGDINNDGKVDVSDYIGIANHILGTPQAYFNEDAADVNNDGKIDVSDYIGVANIILKGNVNGE